VDSHTADECWEKNPQLKPDKWRKRDGEAKPAYAADTVEPGTPPAVEMEQSGFTAWTAAIQTNCPREAFTVFTDQGRELRPTTLAQRDTEPAARAKEEADRQAARAKEDRVRLGGPPPGFRPQGERRAGEETEAPPAAPRADRRRGQAHTAAPVAESRALPPGFGEYSLGDPRYVGLTDAEQSGVRMELLAAPVVGPVRGEVVVCRAPTAYMVGVQGGEDAIIKRMHSISTKLGVMRGEASDLLAALSARKEMVHKGVAGGPGKAAGKPAGGPKEGEGVTGGPGKAAGEPDTSPKEGEGGAGGPEKAAGEPGDGPKKGEGGAGGLGKAAGEPESDPKGDGGVASGPEKAVGGPTKVSGKGTGDTSGPGKTVGGPTTRPKQGIGDAGGPVKAAGGPIQPSRGDQWGPSGAESTAGGPQAGSSAEQTADATTEGSGGGRGNKGAGKGAESEVPEERASSSSMRKERSNGTSNFGACRCSCRTRERSMGSWLSPVRSHYNPCRRCPRRHS
jgi:hypothetical protein